MHKGIKTKTQNSKPSRAFELATKMKDNTWFAPAGRASERELRMAASQVGVDRVVEHLAIVIPDLVLVLNAQRLIVAISKVALSELGIEEPEDWLGKRPGELLGCQNADVGPDGCGISPNCSLCGAALVHGPVQPA